MFGAEHAEVLPEKGGGAAEQRIGGLQKKQSRKHHGGGEQGKDAPGGRKMGEERSALAAVPEVLVGEFWEGVEDQQAREALERQDREWGEEMARAASERAVALQRQTDAGKERRAAALTRVTAKHKQWAAVFEDSQELQALQLAQGGRQRSDADAFRADVTFKRLTFQF